MNAFVMLVMKGDNYGYGAITVAHSLRLHDTKHKIVCMVTNDVSKEMKANIKKVVDHVYVVDYLSFPSKQLKTESQTEKYGNWIGASYTKWNCLQLEKFNKVCFLDADQIVVKNIDHIFDVEPPAAVFNLVWQNNNQFYVGEKIVPDVIHYLLEKSMVGSASVVVLKPSIEVFNRYYDFILAASKEKPYGHNGFSGYDEQSIAEFYSKEKVEWTVLSSSYMSIMWKHKDKITVDAKGLPDPSILHFMGVTKPWLPDSDVTWDDARLWMCFFADAIAAGHGVVLDEKNKSEGKESAALSSSLSKKVKTYKQRPCPFCHFFELPADHDVFESTGKLTCPILK